MVNALEKGRYKVSWHKNNRPENVPLPFSNGGSLSLLKGAAEKLDARNWFALADSTHGQNPPSYSSSGVPIDGLTLFEEGLHAFLYIFRSSTQDLIPVLDGHGRFKA